MGIEIKALRNRSSAAILFPLLLIVLALIGAGACGDGNDGDSGTGFGSIALWVVWDTHPQWPDDSIIKGIAGAGVESIAATVTADDIATPIASITDTTPGLAGTGTVDGVPVGDNRTLTLQGLDTSDTVTWQSASMSLDITAGQTTDAGTVVMEMVTDSTVDPFNPASPWVAALPKPTAVVRSAISAVDGIIYLSAAPDDQPGVLVEAYDVSGNSWTTKADMPTPRTLHASAATGGIVYVFGGSTTSNEAAADMDGYDPGTDTWSSFARIPTQTDEPASASVGGKILVIGGGGPLSTVQIYDPVTDSWGTGANMPTARLEACSVAIDGIVYVFGGVFFATGPSSDVVEAYDPAIDIWKVKAAMPRPRSEHGCAAVGSGLTS
ncbi:MAG: hypothetical protein IID61_10650 [SAR324 cluster bacterium]|nr:hypothetical protein [SAR324 cluster bacterium]